MNHVSLFSFKLNVGSKTVDVHFLGGLMATIRDTPEEMGRIFGNFVGLARGNDLHPDFFEPAETYVPRRCAGKDVARGAILVDLAGDVQSPVQWSVARAIARANTVAEKATLMMRLQPGFAGHERPCVAAKNLALAVAHWELSKKV
jgi:hypothetical protein